jgi:hypothetical protein
MSLLFNTGNAALGYHSGAYVLVLCYFFLKTRFCLDKLPYMYRMQNCGFLISFLWFMILSAVLDVNLTESLVNMV